MQPESGLYTRNVARLPSLVDSAPHRISLIRTGNGSGASWLAEVEGLPGCSARAATPEEAVQQAWAAAERTTTAAGAGEAEKPKEAARHSGKLLVRMPATLHDELAKAAESEGVSLNQLITGVLASAVEWRSAEGRPASRAAPADAGGLPARLTRAVLAANLVVVLVAAGIAIALLVAAWRSGF